MSSGGSDAAASSKTFIIMRGTTGMGKSHLSSLLESRHEALICSNDRWWPKYAPGKAWNIQQHCREAIPWCAGECRRGLDRGESIVVLDNLNMKKSNFKALFDHANEQGYGVLVVDLCPKDEVTARQAVERNVRPGWTSSTKRRMAELAKGYEPYAFEGAEVVQRDEPLTDNSVYQWLLERIGGDAIAAAADARPSAPLASTLIASAEAGKQGKQGKKRSRDETEAQAWAQDNAEITPGSPRAAKRTKRTYETPPKRKADV